MNSYDQTQLKALIKVLENKDHTSVVQKIFYPKNRRHHNLPSGSPEILSLRDNCIKILDKIEDDYFLEIFKKYYPYFLMFTKHHNTALSKMEQKDIFFFIIDDISKNFYNINNSSDFLKQLFSLFYYVFDISPLIKHNQYDNMFENLMEYLFKSQNKFLIISHLLICRMNPERYLYRKYNDKKLFELIENILSTFFINSETILDSYLNSFNFHIVTYLYNFKKVRIYRMVDSEYYTSINNTLIKANIDFMILNKNTLCLDSFISTLDKSNILSKLNNLDKNLLKEFKTDVLSKIDIGVLPQQSFRIIRKFINTCKLLNIY